MADTVELQLADHGPRYAETDLGRLPVEPVNTLSNLVFVAVAVLALRRLNRLRLWSPFFTAVMIVLGIGWIGGTVYHATRSSVLWLALDWVPIAGLCCMASVRFALQLKRPLRTRLVCLGLPLVLALVIGSRLVGTPSVRVSLGYVVLAALVACPALMYSVQMGGRRVGLLVGAVAAFLVALAFRLADAGFISERPRLGTHFLWHLFGGAATYLVLEYLLRDAEERMARTQQDDAVGDA